MCFFAALEGGGAIRRPFCIKNPFEALSLNF